MLTMFTAIEARATACLLSPKDYSIYQHIEIRISDSVQHGGTNILYGGEITHNVVDALRALGYKVTRLEYEGKQKMIRIDWSHAICSGSLDKFKEIEEDAEDT